MAFKNMEDYNKERFDGVFTLRDDGSSADVIFLYRSVRDCLVADTHYIKSADYSGYVHCCGRGCPACAQNIRVQTKLFIPLYNIETGEIVFWDRNIRFDHQLKSDVFDKFPNPSDYVFRITRHGAAGDINTTYEITAIARNTAALSYDNILAQNHISFPDAYSQICKDMDAHELSKLLVARTTSTSTNVDMPEYQVTPRAIYSPNPQIVSTNVDSDISDFAEDIMDTDPADGDVQF